MSKFLRKFKIKKMPKLLKTLKCPGCLSDPNFKIKINHQKFLHSIFCLPLLHLKVRVSQSELSKLKYLSFNIGHFLAVILLKNCPRKEATW